MTEHDKAVIDAISLSWVVAAILNYVPAITAVVSLVWVCIRLYETKTVQGLIQRHRRRK